MRQFPGLEKIRSFFTAIKVRYGITNHFFLLCMFLLAVLVISFIIPLMDFGRFFGTDDYTHLFHTQQMGSSIGISDFYDRMGEFVSNPYSDDNLYNYPFGVWLLGGTIAKITGLSVISGAFLWIVLFLLIIIGSFYVYSGIFLDTKEQKILAVLFLLSMPNIISSLLSYRPSVFTLPFLYIIVYFVLKEPIQWKLLLIAWLSIFVIIISHTGTFIFLISFSILFYLLYCLLWGRSSLPAYLVILSTFVIYIFSLTWFPQIGSQYELKSTLFLSPGNFLATNFNFSLPSELGNLFYQNIMVNHELAYSIVMGAFIFVLGKLFRYIHRKLIELYYHSDRFYAITLPISNISHNVAATPLWAGPIHVMLSFLGFFRLDNKGKCVLFSLLIVTILPDLLFESSQSSTGILREISYLALIIPITATLGFCQIISYIETRHPQKKVVLFSAWFIVLLAIIITPAVSTTYYLPRISGEDHIIMGMQWLGDNGDISEKVIGYGLRTVPIYTNMTDAGYGVQTGYETRTLRRLLSGMLFSANERNIDELRKYFGVKYILISEKIAANIGGPSTGWAIDNNTGLNKIYSSKDFGIYENILQSKNASDKKMLADNVYLEKIGSSYLIETEVYKVVVNENYPVIEQFGSPKDNYLGEGFFLDNIKIWGFRQGSYVNPFIPFNESEEQNVTVDQFLLNNLSIIPEIVDNQIIYRTVLKDQLTGENESSLIIKYTFYPTTIKRDFFISNDWVVSADAPSMNVGFSTSLFAPLNDFKIKSNQTSLNRHIYPSQDSVKITEYINDLYIHDMDRGIYIKIEPTAAYPTSMTYRGSTLYNMSSISFSQSDSLKPGATLHVTQYLSPGDEVTAEKNILAQERISLLKYPNGMIPIILSGYRTPDSEIGSADVIDKGYSVLINESVPYTEAVVPEQVREITVFFENATTTVEPLPTPATINVTTTVNMRSIHDRNIKIVGSSTTTGEKTFNNYSTQVKDITAVIKKARDTDIPLIGYMPAQMNYNLDTLKIVADNHFTLIYSTPVSPPYFGIIGLENRNPQLAWYHNERSNITLFPVSYPLSSALTAQTDNSVVFSAWKATIDESVANDGMVLFIIRSADVGNPKYTDAILSMISYAKANGLTFTTPEIIADYLKKIENVDYQGSIQGDMASIMLTNNNNETLQDVTLKVIMPNLKDGEYKVNEGKVVRIKTETKNIAMYIITDIPARGTKKITIEPAFSKKQINVTLPRYPIEGDIQIFVEDMDGRPLADAEVIIDTKYYALDGNGGLSIALKRGMHAIRIQNPGYETYSSTLEVKGRIYALKQFFNL